MADNNALVATDGKSVITKDPEEQLRKFEEYAKQHALQAKQPTGVATTKCPVHYESDIKGEFEKTPLIQAIEEDNVIIAEKYIRNCTDISVRGGAFNGFPINHAVLRDNLYITRLLLEHGADPNVQDLVTFTPMHMVRSVEMVNLLVEYGADPDFKTDGGNTPITLAFRREIIGALIKHGADLNLKVNVDVVCSPYYFPDHPICHEDAAHLSGESHHQEVEVNA